MPAIQLSEGFPDPNGLAEDVRGADVVIGVDSSTGTVHIFWGLATLRRIERRGVAESLTVLRIPIDFDPRFGDLEALVATVKAVKGACSYGSEGYTPPCPAE